MAGLAVGLLGPLVISTGGQPVEISTPRLRSMLAALAVSAGRIVSLDHLSAAVWGPDEDQPHDVRRTLQTYVTRLRGLLGADSIDTRPEGYLLHTDPDQVDALRMDRLLDAAAVAPDQVTERALLIEALALWRGEPFTGISSAWLAQSEEPRLVERYLTAVERRVDLDLEGGRHGELGPQLRTLTARHPLRETLWVRLLVVLARCGRTAEALDRYETIRRRLADDLGVDPGPELRQIHADLLAGGTPAPRHVGRAPTVRTVPQQLPADVTGFAGRTEHLRELHALLPPEPGSGAAQAAVIVVHGTAGVGKSSLVVHFAHQVRDRFPDGQLYVNLRGFDPSGSAMNAAEVLPGFLDGLGVPQQHLPSGLETQLGRYRSAMAGKRVLVVLDDARDAAQVRPLLPGSPGCLVVVTSRSQLPGLVAIDGAHPIAVDLLSADEARALLARRIGPDRVAAEPQPTDEIIDRCARLPLALAIVAARAAIHPGFPLRALATELRHARGSLYAFPAADETIDIRNAFSWSYDNLSAGAARLFRLLGTHPGPDLAAPAASSLAELPLPEARALLEELADAHLVTEHLPGRFTFHDLLRAYAAELAHAPDHAADGWAAMSRMLDHYLHAADAAADLLDPHRLPISVDPPAPGVTPARPGDRAAAIDWLTAEQRVLLEAVRQAGDNGFEAHAWRLAAVLVEFLARRGRWHEFADIQRIAVSAAERVADQVGQAHAYHSLGRANGKLGRYDDAHACYQRALDLFRAVGDHAGQASAHLGIGWLLGRRRRFREGIDHAWQAHRRYQSSGDEAGQANALNAVGWYHAKIGEYSQALVHCQQAATMHSRLADRQGAAYTWDSMGYAHHHLGDHQQAIICYRWAVALYREAGDRYGEADTLTRLGDAQQAGGNPHAARTSWQQAGSILDEFGHPDAERLHARLNPTRPTFKATTTITGLVRRAGPGPAGRHLADDPA